MPNEKQLVQSALTNVSTPSLPPKPRIALDARAAELREKLLRNRKKGEALARETEPTILFQQLPQQPPQTPFLPNANDIAALISSSSPVGPQLYGGIPGLGQSIPPTTPQVKPSSSLPPAQGPNSSLEEGEVSTTDSHGTTRDLSSVPKADSVQAEPISPVEAMQRLLDQVPDLKDWLEITEYYDAESRTKKLDRYRRAKVLVAERKRLEEEERKLLEEEEREKEQRPTSVRPTSASTHDIAASLLTSASTSTAVSRKRDYSDDRDGQRREKTPRLDDSPDRRSDHGYQRKYSGYKGGGGYRTFPSRGGGRKSGRYSPRPHSSRRHP
ncbi:hypothetical protein QBC44DRAFT_336698 [Cladorrhinum sp. PSN332]|nr:hypothetical protein QBC44DRAFT_336698 [Cladorrhinum sp. PSN332]